MAADVLPDVPTVVPEGARAWSGIPQGSTVPARGHSWIAARGSQTPVDHIWNGEYTAYSVITEGSVDPSLYAYDSDGFDSSLTIEPHNILMHPNGGGIATNFTVSGAPTGDHPDTMSLGMHFTRGVNSWVEMCAYRVRPGAGVLDLTGATPVWGGTPPTDLASLQTYTDIRPPTAWPPGKFITVGGINYYWTGTAWSIASSADNKWSFEHNGITYQLWMAVPHISAPVRDLVSDEHYIVHCEPHWPYQDDIHAIVYCVDENGVYVTEAGIDTVYGFYQEGVQYLQYLYPGSEGHSINYTLFGTTIATYPIHTHPVVGTAARWPVRMIGD